MAGIGNRFYEVIDDQRPDKAPERYEIPARKDYAWEREYQRQKQAYLLERLRYKGYQRRGTLASHMQRLGNFGRRQAWWWVLVPYLIFALRFLR